MQMVDKKTQDSNLQRWTVTLATNDAALFYFLLEAHDGSCFYSTLDCATAGLRVIELLFDHSTMPMVEHLLAQIEVQQLFSYDLKKA